MDERALALFLYVPIVVVIARCKIHKEMGPPCCLALVGYVGVVMSSQQFALLTIPIVGLLGRLVYSWPLATRGD